jgi:hypothetical protein
VRSTGYFPRPRDRASFPGQGDEETSGSAGIQLTRGLTEHRFLATRDSFQEWVIHGDLDLIPAGKGLTEHSLSGRTGTFLTSSYHFGPRESFGEQKDIRVRRRA